MSSRYEDDFEDIVSPRSQRTERAESDTLWGEEEGAGGSRRWTDTAEQYLDHMDETDRAAREAEEAVSDNPIADEVRARASSYDEGDRRGRDRSRRSERGQSSRQRESSSRRRPATDEERRARNEEIRRTNREERARLRQDEGSSRPPKRGGAFKWILAALLVIALVGGGIFGISRLRGGSTNILSDLGPKDENYYETHFLPYTTVNGIDVSGKTPDEAKSLLADSLSSYTLTITGREDDQVLDAEAGKLTLREDLDLSSLLAGQDHENYKRAESEGDSFSVESVAQADEFHIRDAIASLPICNSSNMTMSQDAYVYYDPDSDSFKLIEGVAGTWVDVNALGDRAIECFESLTPVLDLEEEGFYVPTIQVTDQMRQDVEEMSGYLNAQVQVVFDENHVETMGKEALANCVKLTYEGTAEFDDAGVRSWLGELSGKYDTAGSSHVFTTAEGRTISVTGGTYGWLMDVDAMTEKVVEGIKSGAATRLDPIYEQTAKVVGSRDIGTTYVEVSLQNQRLYYYQEGTRLLAADIISGDVAGGHETPQGVYTVTDKQISYILAGTDDIPDREVDRWMPFADAYGITGASWRSAFGGTIYQSQGTLGSIYLSEEDAQSLYSMVETGTPVVIYGAQKELPAETEAEAVTREYQSTERDTTEATRSTRSETQATRSTESTSAATEAPAEDDTEVVDDNSGDDDDADTGNDSDDSNDSNDSDDSDDDDDSGVDEPEEKPTEAPTKAPDPEPEPEPEPEPDEEEVVG